MAKNKLFGLISAVLFLLVGIFSFLKIFTAKISFLGMSQSIGGSLLEMKMTLATIAVILLALVAVCGLVCALLGKYKIAMIAALVELIVFIVVFFVLKGKLTKELGDYASAVELVLFIIVFFVVKGKINSLMSKELGGLGDLASLASSALSVHISFLGWLHMIFTVAAGALAFLAGKKEVA